MTRFATMTPATRMIIVIVLALSAAINLAALAWVLWERPSLNSDFMAFWSFPRFVQAHRPEDIYNAQALVAFQQTLYSGFHSFYPYLYPPTLLVATGWLADFHFVTAQFIWTLSGLCLLLAALMLFLPPGSCLWVTVAMLASPASLIDWMTGETAYFTTGLLLLGLAALPRKKALAGVAFGLLTLKPQLGVLLPFALLALGEWRVIVITCATACLLVMLSCIAYPPDLWAVWARSLPVYQTQYFNGGGLNLNILVTPAANLIVLGVKPGIAWLVQTAISVCAAAAVFLAFRKGPYLLAVAVLLIASFIAVPHAYAYDTITLTAALFLLGASLPMIGTGFLALGLVVYLGPYLLLSPGYHWFLYGLPELALLAWAVGLVFGKANRALEADEPEFYHSGA